MPSIARGWRRARARASLPLEPFHGTIGVAPAAFERRNVLVPAEFGGNMDTPEAKAGTTIYLGVNVEGALFSLGDGHYRMGEGEPCGVSVEGAMQTRAGARRDGWALVTLALRT